MRYIVWLQDITDEQAPIVGGKAARLGELLRLHFPVPAGFCLTTAAFDRCTEGHSRLPEHLSDDVLAELHAACDRLASVAPPNPLFAVRSSATSEDQATASFAGQFDTFLNVPPSEIAARILDCWVSAWNARSSAYTRQRNSAVRSPQMAVIVQIMIPCRVAGVAFSCDPVGGRQSIVIEAVPGLGDALMSGRVTPRRYTLQRTDPSPRGDDLLRGTTLLRIGELVTAAERAFSCPQDMEWGLADDLYVFQARPITTLPEGDDIFSEPSASDTIWTAGFFNERFPQPVSPLGWSLLRKDIEQLALRDPLQFMGTPGCDTWQLIRLYRGHPYANMRVFQTLYKVFPDSLLPEDARRFFIHNDVALRRKVPYPRSIFDPRFLLSMLRHFVRDWQEWSPLHNCRLWEAFVREYDTALAAARQRMAHESGVGLLTVAADIRRLNRRLLAIHRWSLTDADICYSLLCRLLRTWVDSKHHASLAAGLTTGIDNWSLRTNRALAQLARLAASDPALLDDLKTGLLDRSERGRAFSAALREFLDRYGHRSPSLDIVHPSLADDRDLLVSLLHSQMRPTTGSPEQIGPRVAASVGDVDGEDAERRVRSALATGWANRLLPWRWLVVRGLVRLTREYMRLREDQRFYWQKGLALLRGIYLRLGSELAQSGYLDDVGDVFFLTADEVEQYVSSGLASPASLADVRRRVALRHRIFARLTAEYKAAPGVSYRPFLRGDEPLIQGYEHNGVFEGRAVSPGLAKGPAHIIVGPEGFADVPQGCILVAPTADPGWTPLFCRVRGLVLEHGGQLSHGAVVAREYGLPAVAGVAGITRILRNGEFVVVDGSVGLVIRNDGVSAFRQEE